MDIIFIRDLFVLTLKHWPSVVGMLAFIGFVCAVGTIAGWLDAAILVEAVDDQRDHFRAH